MSRCLQLDVGNSSAKWRLVQAGEVLSRGWYTPGDDASRALMLGCAPTMNNIWISSVAGPESEEALAALLREQWGVTPWFARSEGQTGDLLSSYEDPSRMGVDRWLAMLGARQRCTERVCVVDAGSALTIDLVASSGQHEGGYIIPGPTLMERALLLDTDRVRFAEEIGYGLAPGESTAEAVRHGIALAQAGSVALALQQCGPDQPSLLICGGAGQMLEQMLPMKGEYCPDLVFEGLELMGCERAP